MEKVYNDMVRKRFRKKLRKRDAPVGFYNGVEALGSVIGFATITYTVHRISGYIEIKKGGNL